MATPDEMLKRADSEVQPRSKVLHAKFPINGHSTINAQIADLRGKARNNQRQLQIHGMQRFIKRSMAENEVMNYSSNICHELCSANINGNLNDFKASFFMTSGIEH